MNKEQWRNVEVNLEERYLRPQIAEAMEALGMSKPCVKDIGKIFDKTKELIVNIDIGIRPHLAEFDRKNQNGEVFDAIDDYREAKNAAYHWGIRSIDEIELQESEVVLLCWDLFNSRVKNAGIDLAINLTESQDLICMFDSYPLISLDHMSGNILPHNKTLIANEPFGVPVGEGERVIFKTNLLKRPEV